MVSQIWFLCGQVAGCEGGDGAVVKLLKGPREEEISKVVWAVVRNNHPVGFDRAVHKVAEVGEARLGFGFQDVLSE
jgi:hypothetical protein